MTGNNRAINVAQDGVDGVQHRLAMVPAILNRPRPTGSGNRSTAPWAKLKTRTVSISLLASKSLRANVEHALNDSNECRDKQEPHGHSHDPITKFHTHK